LAGLSHEKSINEIVKNIQKFVLPIFEIFDSKETVIEFLKSKGTKFNPYCENSLFPLDFLLCHSNHETSELFFSNYIKKSDYKEKLISFFEKLKNEKEIDLNHSEFVDAAKIKLAFINKLSVK